MIKPIDESARQEITTACLRLLNAQVDFIEGCRELVALRNRFNLEIDPCFYPFVGVVSETDDYPTKEGRKHFSYSYLNKVDREISEYISQVRPSILEACNELLTVYSL
jgi:hypothetical protein